MKEKCFTLRDFVDRQDCTLEERMDLFEKNYFPQFEEDKLMNFWTGSSGKIDTEMIIVDKYTGEKRKVISFVSNNYLGYSKHPEVISASINILKEYGCGMGAAPCIGGYADLQIKLEKELAAFLHCEDSLIFSAGFNANCGPLLSLLRKCDIALVDMYVHSSVYEGLYNTNTKILKHNDTEYLEKTLSQIEGKYKTKMVIVDGVYSQDGDIADLPKLIDICKKYNALLWVDDAHGIGVIGENGKGAIEHYNALGKVDIISGTLSKSFGSVGGFIAGSNQLINFLRYHAKTSIFSAAPTPQSLASALKALELMQREPELREKIFDNRTYFKEELTKLGFNTGISETQIIPLIIGDDMKTHKAARLLLERGVYVAAITYPGVKTTDARLRFGILATHTTEQLDFAISQIIEVDKLLKIR